MGHQDIRVAIWEESGVLCFPSMGTHQNSVPSPPQALITPHLDYCTAELSPEREWSPFPLAAQPSLWGGKDGLPKVQV